MVEDFNGISNNYSLLDLIKKFKVSITITVLKKVVIRKL